ncbi:hypothetical protein QFZ69_003969 [Arthrobacter sp. V1I7]|nr:hypothetical protein [Arthrobacter sp. V1I7]
MAKVEASASIWEKLSTCVVGFFAVVGEVVEQTGELQWTADLAGNHLRSHAAFADQQAGADQFVHGLAHGRAGQIELGRKVDFVVEAAARFQDTAVDGGLDALNYLVVQGHGGGAVDVETKLIRHCRFPVFQTQPAPSYLRQDVPSMSPFVLLIGHSSCSR